MRTINVSPLLFPFIYQFLIENLYLAGPINIAIIDLKEISILKLVRIGKKIWEIGPILLQLQLLLHFILILLMDWMNVLIDLLLLDDLLVPMHRIPPRRESSVAITLFQFICISVQIVTSLSTKHRYKHVPRSGKSGRRKRMCNGVSQNPGISCITSELVTNDTGKIKIVRKHFYFFLISMYLFFIYYYILINTG